MAQKNGKMAKLKEDKTMRKIQDTGTDTRSALVVLRNMSVDDAVAFIQYVRSLQHEHDTTRGLWCTDKPDAIPADKKHLFFQLD